MNEKLKAKLFELQEKYGKIKIQCKGAEDLPFETIKNFQGKLKKLSQENAVKLATSLFINGFCAPFFVWKNKDVMWCIDGHQRMCVLTEMHNIGIELPALFPVCYIKAESEKEARQKLLAITSQ
jgi:hypothetical protein